MYYNQKNWGYENNRNFEKLLTMVQNIDANVKFDVFFAPELHVQSGRQRIFDKQEIVDQPARFIHVKFETFYVLLGSCLFQNPLLVAQESFNDFFPHNLKRGNITGLSVLMSTKKSSKEDARVIDQLRFG